MGKKNQPRRSKRKRTYTECDAELDAKHTCDGDYDGFVVKMVVGKGRAVFTTKTIIGGSFLFTYCGEHISEEEGQARDEVDETGFRFFMKGKKLCVDASEEPQSSSIHSLGRLVNHARSKREENCRVKAEKDRDGNMQLNFYTTKDIPADTELLYNYGLPHNYIFPPPRLPQSIVMGMELGDSQADRLTSTQEDSVAQAGDKETEEKPCLIEVLSTYVNGDIKLHKGGPICDSPSDACCPEGEDDHTGGLTHNSPSDACCPEVEDDHTGGLACNSPSDARGSEVEGDHTGGLTHNSPTDAHSSEVEDDHTGGLTHNSPSDACCPEVEDDHTGGLACNSPSDARGSEVEGDHTGGLTHNSPTDVHSSEVEDDHTGGLTHNSPSDAHSPEVEDEHPGGPTSSSPSDARSPEFEDDHTYGPTCSSLSDAHSSEDEDDHTGGPASNSPSDAYSSEDEDDHTGGPASNSLSDAHSSEDEDDHTGGPASNSLSDAHSSEDEDDYTGGPASNSSSDTCSSEVEADHRERRGVKQRVLQSPIIDSTVQRIARKIRGKRVWNKKDYCLYCSKAELKIVRHCMTHHKKEKLVREITDLPKGSKHRRDTITKLRNKGNLKHNEQVWTTGKGQIVPRKRPRDLRDAVEYLPCTHCLGSFQKDALAKHQQKCCDANSRVKGKRVQSEAKMMIPDKATDAELREKVLRRMNVDNVTREVRSDPDILTFGSRLLKGHNKPHQELPISQNMRDLARLVIAAKEIDSSIDGLRDLIDPKKFEVVVESVRKVAKYNADTKTYETPSYARNIGYSLDKVIVQVRSSAIRNSQENSDVLKKQVDDFEELKKSDWSNEILIVAHQNLQDRKRNKSSLLPLAEDIKKMTKHVKDGIRDHMEELQRKPDSTKDWMELCKLTLTHVVMFNRRRSGETERLMLEDYKKIQDRGDMPQVPKEVFDSFGEVEKALCQKLCRIEVIGKRGRTVPIVLTHDMQMGINLLNRTRKHAGVSDDNPYVFARPYFQSKHAMTTSKAMKQFADECGAKLPENVRSSNLRKHIATMTQLLSLKENELDMLAGYMGHDIRVHREFYRLPQSTLQLAKVSKVLIMMERGLAGEFRGKSLDEIDIDLDEDDAESDDDSSQETCSVASQEVDDAERDHDSRQEAGCSSHISDDAGSTQMSYSGAQVSGTTERSKTSTKKRMLQLPSIETTQGRSTTRVRNVRKQSQSGKGSKQRRNYDKRRDWTSEEKEIVLDFFKEAIRNNTVPNAAMCREAQHAYPLLLKRKWSTIKDFVRAEGRRRIRGLQKQIY